MRWKPARGRDLQLLEPFLLAGEWKSVALSARFCRQGTYRLPPRSSTTVYYCARFARSAPGAPTAPHGEVAGVLLRTTTGLLLPLLREGDLDGLPLPPERAGGDLYSIMGTHRDVRWLETRLTGIPEIAVEYHLMILRREGSPASLQASVEEQSPPKLTVRPATEADLPALFPLQKSYELEEVVLRPDHFRDQACYTHLKRTLKTQLTYLAEISGRVVAKAGTNARGRQCDQIGGVYTVEHFRNQGIGLALMEVLLKKIFREKSSVTLFVKKNNLPAVALYRRLGFETAEAYRISYFRS